MELAKDGIRCEQFLLFGSQARGTAHEWSDIDLIVVSPDWAGLDDRERLELAGVAAIRLLEPIHAQGFTPDEIANHQLTTFWEYVLAEAVPVAA
jgi:predicted nucleotidyltransferase